MTCQAYNGSWDQKCFQMVTPLSLPVVALAVSADRCGLSV